MLIPIGHDQQTVRRLPWVTIAIIAANFVVFLAAGTSQSDVESKVKEAHDRVWQYALDHPHLELSQRFFNDVVPPGRREEMQTLLEARKSMVPAPETSEEREHDQRVLDGLVQAFYSARTEHPYTQWGLVPASFSFLALFTSMFMHAGWLHLLGNMFMLYLAGPSIEDAYGRPMFAGFYVVSGAVAAIAHVAAFPHSEAPLIGASGAIAGIMGAFLIRCTKTRIRFFYTLFLHGGTFSAPAWFMLPLWLLQQAFFASLTSSADGVAYTAHIAGFVFGAVVAVVIKTTRVEERFIHPAIEREISIEQHPALEEGMALLVRGETVAAREELRKALAADPRNPDVHLAMWQTYVHEGVPAQGADHMARVVEEELRRGEKVLALDHWRELVAATGQGGPAPLRWRLAGELAEEEPVAAQEILRQLAADPTAGLLGEKARIKLGPAVTVSHAAAVPPPLAAGMAPTEAIPTPRPQPEMLPSEPTVGAYEPSAMDWGPEPQLDLEAGPAEASLVIESCTLERVDGDGIFMRGEGGAIELLLYSQVEAVAVAGISGPGKPYLIVDIIQPEDATGGRTICRALSTQMNPAEVVGQPGAAPLEAFRELVRRLVAGANARLLPSEDALRRFPMFASPEEYQSHVLAELEQVETLTV